MTHFLSMDPVEQGAGVDEQLYLPHMGLLIPYVTLHTNKISVSMLQEIGNE